MSADIEERWIDIADGARADIGLPDPSDNFTMTAALGAHDLVNQAIALNQLLGYGAFSRVYALTDTVAVKFTTDIDAMQAVQRLGDRSPFFPKVHDVLLAEQARDEEGTPYAAMVMERLHTGLPVWVYTLVRAFGRGMQHEGSSRFGHMQLMRLKYFITNGDVNVNPSIAGRFAEAIGLLADECLAYDLVPDLKTEANFMSRANREIVIADPAHAARRYNR